jgi:H+/Cl- antiporter ClcA
LFRLSDWRRWWATRFEASRLILARPEALLLISLLGLITGLFSGAVILVFRLSVEGVQERLLPGSGPENFEALLAWQRFVLPVLGGLLLALIFKWLAKGLHTLGVAGVIDRMTYHQGHISVRGLLLQFVSAAIAIISGHSVGREGPHVYLGAAVGSVLGQRLIVPNNAIRTLVACGTAAGIAASFNTPLAGVIFALEVVMMEYSAASFIPVILAAISATALSSVFLGTQPAFTVQALQLQSLTEMGVVVVLGIAAGTVSAAFIEIVQRVASRSAHLKIWWRMAIAGLIVGLIGVFVPQVMGIGYDSVNIALNGNFTIGLLALLVVAKLFATAIAIGLGIPGGTIGPSLFIGAMLGSLIAACVNLIGVGPTIEPGFYALLGLGAMMSGSLQAPLAALTAMLELTHNPAVILPGMVAVVVAGLTASEVFRKRSLFISTLQATGRDYRTSPVLQALRRSGVASAMDRRFVSADSRVSRQTAEALLARKPAWILVGTEGSPKVGLPAIDLANHLESKPDAAKIEEIDLLAIPAKRLQLVSVNLQATLQQALELLDEKKGEALYVESGTVPGLKRIYGVLTRQTLESAYR